MTEQAEHVDWDEIERRERRSGVPAFLVVVAFFAAMTVLTGGFAFWEGQSAWIALGVFLGIMIAVQAVTLVLGARSGPRTRMLRFRYALMHRVDPGPGVREKVDVAARRMASTGWAWWIFPLGPVFLVLGAPWDRPLLAVPSAVVLLASSAWFALYWRRMTAAASRWVADPPGPERDVPPPTRLERLTTGRGLKWLMVGVIVAGVVLGLVLAFFFSD